MVNKNTDSINDNHKILKALQTIPGIGKACSIDLWNIGIRSIDDLVGANPKILYEKLNTVTGFQHDICILV
ncbi:MAG: hypothetical protein H7141_04190 [Burkholderiales bacterium]|nr:hypothetical protein [Bacteroidia bacterium]